jgi:hypothetical protein
MTDEKQAIETLLDKMLAPVFSIESKSYPGVSIPCRDLPNTTLMALIKEATSAGREEIAQARAEFFAAMTEIAVSSGDDKSEAVSAVDAQQALRLATPLLTRLVILLPNLSDRVLRDVIIGSTDQVVEMLSVVDATAIIAEAFERVNVDVVAENLRKVFHQATTVWQTIKTNQEEAKQSKVEAPPSSPQEE